MTRFQEAILRIVQMVPSGKVVSYGQVAAYIGMPRAARQVGWAMRSMEGISDMPWWRVLNNAGVITIKGNQFNDAKLQRELLEAEGVIVHNYALDMNEYRFRPPVASLQKFKLDPAYADTVLAKYSAN